MCEVATATAIAGLAITAIATGVSAYSSYQQAESQNKANDYNAAMMQRNAKVSEMQGQQVIDQGKVDEDLHRQKVRQMIGTQRAGLASGGLTVDEGTALDVTSDTAGFGEMDALTIRSNSQRAAWGISNNTADLQSQAALASMKNTSPWMAGGTSLLSGGSRLAGQVYQYRDVFGSQRPGSVPALPV